MIYLITAPSGAGKDHLVKQLGYPKIITFTTRPPRKGERNIFDYYFVTIENFKTFEMLGVLAESSKYDGHWYGTPKAILKCPGNYSLIVEPEGSKKLGDYMDKEGIQYQRIWINTPICLRHMFLTQDKSRQKNNLMSRVNDDIKMRWDKLGLLADITLPTAGSPLPLSSINVA